MVFGARASLKTCVLFKKRTIPPNVLARADKMIKSSGSLGSHGSLGSGAGGSLGHGSLGQVFNFAVRALDGGGDLEKRPMLADVATDDFLSR